MIFAASFETSVTGLFQLGSPAGKQLIFIGVGAVLFMMTMLIDWKFWSSFAFPIYIISIVLLILVLLVGSTIKGSTSWFSIGAFSLQPAEFAKFGTALALAAYLSYYKTSLKQFRHQGIALGIILLPIALILLQPDAGSALVFLSFFVLLYREGLSPWIFIIGGILIGLFILSLLFQPVVVISFLFALIAIVVARRFLTGTIWLVSAGALLLIETILIVKGIYQASLALSIVTLGFATGKAFMMRHQRQFFLVIPLALLCGAISFFTRYSFENFLEPHQRDRINVWLKPSECDPRGSLYNVLQSKIAIGSGGLEGKGFLKGTMTNLNYVPEQTTDFIFSTIGEEQGFIGSLGIILLFTLLMLRIITIAERQRASFARRYAYGVAGILFMHFFVNIGMTMGLVPIIGIPLPFISYGGSSFMGFMLLLGVLLKMDRDRYGL
jgi:rod shape determining protein RodA